ncbi:ClpXP adapter SpxH family protein [Oceanobacillus halotolerans]|uniref:ClpXP adapter SpxH family protein n=1 Tax=Oceanobacillus halotolerans TaxID=2663380 RepID=UPI00299DBC4B|nr:ClpXP adapter SpxH family protein [Oceanobacillus halotolerans]
MSWKYNELKRSNHTNTSEMYGFSEFIQKPLEIYVFVDPLCPECWSLEPYLKKLTVEYGHYFTLRPILSGHLASLNNDAFDKPKKLKDIWERTASRTGMCCDGDLWIEKTIDAPWIASLAIKAAELQGKRAGKLYLRKIQENAFLKKENISDETVLMRCAQEVNLDMDEFSDDLYSSSAKKAFQCDLKLTKEMDVDYIPTIVFFNQKAEEQGLKISGLYPYDIYEHVLHQMLQYEPTAAEKPRLEDFLATYGVVANKEIAVVYDWTQSKAEREMKKLQLKRIVKKITVKHGVFWEYQR